METKIHPFIISPTQYEHVVTYADGHKRIARLFNSTQGYLCEFNKRSRKYGDYFDTTNVVSVEPLDKEKNLISKTRRFLKKVIATLEKSGLWSNILHDFKIIAQLDDERLAKLLRADCEEAEAMAAELGLYHRQGGVDSLEWTVEKGIKKINYDSFGNFAQMFARAIEEKQTFSHFWRKGYDNKIECKLVDYEYQQRIMCAWYCEEYKGLGNGHYYIAIDATHAIFAEDD